MRASHTAASEATRAPELPRTHRWLPRKATRLLRGNAWAPIRPLVGPECTRNLHVPHTTLHQKRLSPRWGHAVQGSASCSLTASRLPSSCGWASGGRASASAPQHGSLRPGRPRVRPQALLLANCPTQIQWNGQHLEGNSRPREGRVPNPGATSTHGLCDRSISSRFRESPECPSRLRPQSRLCMSSRCRRT